MIKFERHQFLELFDNEIIHNESSQEITYSRNVEDGSVFTIKLKGDKNKATIILQFPELQKEPIFAVEFTNLGKISTDQKELKFYKQNKMQWCDLPYLHLPVKPTVELSYNFE